MTQCCAAFCYQFFFNRGLQLTPYFPCLYKGNLSLSDLGLIKSNSGAMASVRFLDFQYNLSKRNPSRLFSFSNKQYSWLLPTFQPNPNEMKRVFDRFDRDKDGMISQDEYKAILRAMGKRESMVREIFKVADSNKDGYIDFKEFMALHNNNGDGGVRAMDIRNAFRAFDLDEDGKISAEEVMEMLRRLGERCSLEDCRRMVSAVDMDGDGFISMDEFMTMMTRSMVRY